MEISNNDENPNRLFIRVFVLKIFCQSATYLPISSELNEESDNCPSSPSFKNSFDSDQHLFNILQILCSGIVREVTTLYKQLTKVDYPDKSD